MVRFHHYRKVILFSSLTPSELFEPVYHVGTLDLSKYCLVPVALEF